MTSFKVFLQTMWCIAEMVMSYILDSYTYPRYCNSPWGIYKIDLFNATESIGDSSLEMERGNGEM